MKNRLYFLLQGLLLWLVVTTSMHAQVMINGTDNPSTTYSYYTESMDKAFGTGKWQKLEYGSVNIDELLNSKTSYIYLEGLENDYFDLRVFLETNHTKLENWVKKGNTLYINTCPRYQEEMTFGFGGIQLNQISANTLEAANADHAIFKEPISSIPTAYTPYERNYTTITTLQGSGLQAIITNNEPTKDIVLAEKNWGRGKVLFGTLPSPEYITPRTEYINLRSNILSFKNIPLDINASLNPFTAVISKSEGVQSVSVSMSNYGSLALSKATVNWEVDGVLQTPFTWTKGLPAYQSDGSSKDSLAIGNFTFEKAKKYQVRYWLSQLNGTTMPITQDTLSQTIYTSISGTYAIGGETWDFETLSEAVNTLLEIGVTGPTVFNLAPGDHMIEKDITNIKGTSAVNTLTFQSQSGDNSSTSIYPINNRQSTIVLRDVAYLTFQNLNITLYNSFYSYGHAIFLQEGCHDISFNNCMIAAKTYNYKSSEAATIFFSETGGIDMPYKPCYNITFKNNYISSGSYGIYANPYTKFEENQIKGLRIENNEFGYHFYGGIHLGNGVDLKIIGNKVVESYVETYTGIYLDKAENFTMADNIVTLRIFGTGIYITQTKSAKDMANLVYNNAIYGDGHSTIYCMTVESNEGLSLFHNTVHLSNSYTESAALQILGTNSGLKLYNNNFCVTGSGLAAKLKSFEGLTSDHNNFYTAGLKTFNIDGNVLQGLTDWKSLSHLDSNSVSVNAAFLTGDGYKASKGLLDGGGKPLNEVKTDLEGEPRDPLHPDIGADEFVSSGLDLYLQYAMVPSMPFATGAHVVKIKVSNSGHTDITSFQVETVFNGVDLPKIPWTGVLKKGQSVEISLGALNFQPKANNTLSIDILAPNTGEDVNPDDNTLLYDGLFSSLPSGTYTIGGDRPDFATFGQVQNQLNKGGIMGNVTFVVRDGIYDEHIALSNIYGSGPSGKIAFRSESGDSSKVLLDYYVNNSQDSSYVVKLENTSYVTFTDMSFAVDGRGYATAIDLRGKNSNILFNNNAFISKDNYSQTSYYYALVRITDSIATSGDVVFKNNLLLGSNYGFEVLAKSSPTGKFIAENNILKNQYTNGFWLRNQNFTQLISNTIISATPYTNYYGITVYNLGDGIKILKNKIEVKKAGGIYLDDAKSTATNKLLLANNFVKVDSAVAALYIESSNNSEVYHNTIVNASKNTSHSATKVNGGLVELYNNHFINKGLGYALHFAGVNNHLNSKYDYNNYFSKGTNLMCSNFYSDKPFATLALWKTHAGQDAHSSSLDPMLEGNTSKVTNPRLNGTAMPTPLVTDDIEHKTRGLLPDMGALEFSVAGLNLSLDRLILAQKKFEVGVQPVKILIRNNGTTPVTSFTLKWMVNATVQPDLLWTGNLVPDAIDTVVAGSIDFKLGQKYNIELSAMDPNKTSDLDSSDNKLSAAGLYPSLKGIYTIGGSNPDFATFTAAATVLNQSGVAGNVTFNVRPGTYQEQVRLREISGANAQSRVLFQSENGDNTSTILSYFSSSSKNYTLLLDSTDYVTFKNMTIVSENRSYPSAVIFKSGCSYNVLTGNKIISPINSSYSNIDIYSAKSNSSTWLPNQHNIIEKNEMSNGSYGISISNDFTNKDSNNIIRYNTFRQQRNGAISLRYQESPQITGNHSISDSTSTYYIGIGLVNVSGKFLIHKNKINVLNGGSAIHCESSFGKDTLEALIVNNFCTIKGSQIASGIKLSSTSYLGVYFNSVLHKSSYTTASAFESMQSSRHSVANNNFINMGAGVAAIYGDASNARLIDHNNYYAAHNTAFGSNLSLADWQQQKKVDSNSVSMNPLFLSDTALRPLELSLNTLGMPIKGITEDIDGELRNSLKPSIGADESVPVGNDAGIYKFTNPIPPFVVGERAITVLLRNYGENALKTATINWTLNGTAQSPIAWTGNLNLGDTAIITLAAKFNFMPKSAYTLKAWTSAPNSLADQNAINDTIKLGPIYPALKGTYTIGGSSPNFSTIAEAVEALTNGGIVDSVQFNIRKGTYNEQLTIPAIKGASLRNSIVFQSETGIATDVLISASGTTDKNYVIFLNAVDGISFKDLSLSNTNSAYSRILHVYNGSDYVTTTNVVFNGQATTQFSAVHALIFTETYQDNNNDHLHIMQCTFNKGTYGIYANGTSKYQQGLVVRDNKFNDFYQRGLYLSYQNAPLIQGNTFKCSKDYPNTTGMEVIACSSSVSILDNQIILENGGTGVMIYSHANNINFPLAVVNNFISIKDGSDALGIRIYNSNYVNIYHNTIRIDNQNLAYDVSAIYLYGKQQRLFNNNIYIARKGYLIFAGSSSTTTFSSNYNNFYSLGEYLTYYNDKQLIGMDLWKQTSKQDNLSFSINPNFTSAADPCFSNALLNNTAPSIVGINKDLNGKERKSMTDVGACELEPSGIDAALLSITNPVAPIATNLQDITVQLYNNGAQALNSVRIDWDVNGAVQTPINWTGTLLSQKSVSVKLGTYNLQKSTIYKIKAWTSAPNGSTDFQSINDTIQRNNVALALSGVYSIGGATADYPNFTKAVEALHLHGVVGPVEFRASNGIYSEQLMLEKILGVDAQNTVTFTSASVDSSKVTISFNANSEHNYLIQLKESSYITFKHMTLKALNSNYSNAVVLSDGSGYINVTNCILTGTTNNSQAQALISSTGSSVGNKFLNNLFLEGAYGLYLNGTSSALQGNEIVGNKFQTQTYKAICLTNQRNPVIQNNVFTPLTFRYSDYAAIHITTAKEGALISGNIAILPHTQSIGIYLNGVVGSSSKPALVYNNFTNHLKPYKNTGIYVDFSQYVGLYHNTVRIDGTDTELREAFKVHASNDIDVKNNIFAHYGQGRAMEVTGNPINLTCDYNDYFTNGATLIIRGSSYSSLENYQSAFVTDYNSKSIDPSFVAASKPHIKQVNLDGAGIPIPYVLQDIDGHTRHAENPDIGADEFGAGLITNDIGIVSVLGPVSSCKLDGPQYLVVKLQNFGVDTLTKIDIHYVLNDTLHVTETLEGVQLKGGQAYNYKFKTPILMDAHDLYAFEVYTSMDMDSNHQNDTLFNHTIQHYPISFADAGKDTLICKDQEYYLQAKKAVKYAWHILGSESVYSRERTTRIYPSQKTTYVLKAYNVHDCVAMDTVTVDVLPLPTMPVITVKGALESLCTADSVILTSSIGKNIKWFNGDTTQSVLLTKSGGYSLTHTDPISNCSSTAKVVINKPVTPQISGPGLICPGTEAVLSMSGDGRFLWSTGATTSSITVKPTTTTFYKVKITMPDGCEMERSTTVGIRSTGITPKITSLVGDSAICIGEQSMLRVEGSASSYTWSTGYSGTSINVSPSQKTTYTVTAHGGNCINEVATASFTVDILPGPTQAPIIVATGSNSLSFCETNEITLHSSDYSESILWSTGDTTPFIKVYAQGIYSLSHLSKYGCSKTSSVKIEDPATPYITGKTELCKGQSTTLTVVNGTTVKWSTGASTSSITVRPDTSTEYTVTIQNKEGCTYQQKVKVSIYEIPIVTNISADTSICEGTELTLSVAGKAKEFLWTGGQVGTSIKVKPNKTTTYGVRATNGCPEQSTNDYLNVKVTVLPKPQAALITQGDLLQICPGTTIQLTSSIADSIRWSTKATTQSITVKDTGTYTLYSYNRYACILHNDIKVTYSPKAYIDVEAPGLKTLCRGDNTTLTIINGKNQTWSTGATTKSIWIGPEENTKYVVKGESSLGCAYSDSILIKVVEPIAPEPLQNILPIHGKTDLSLPISLSWSPSANASHYDIRIWEETEPTPEVAQVKNTEQILYRIEKGLEFGKRYNWQVTAKNSCKETVGTIQELGLRHLPDLTVKNVLVPASAFSGQEIMVSWEVKNQGRGRTMSKEYWHEKIYLSSDSIFQADIDQYLGSAGNKTALDTGQSYISSAIVNLPENNVGTYYLFVVSNDSKSLAEIRHDNNTARNKRYLLIQLTPPPDLQVTDVNTLSNIFSGQTMNLSWTVSNKGEGKTIISTWEDRIYFSSDSVLRTGSALVLATAQHSGHLDIKTAYTQTLPVTLPHGIYGKFYIHVVTDFSERVFEHAYNNNNTGRTTAINVTLMPPSDLVPSIVSYPSSASNKDKVLIKWKVKNQGGSLTNTYQWKDEIYISNKELFDTENAKLIGSRINYTALNLGESYEAMATVSIPEQITGTCYIFIITDRANEVFEHDNKANNLVRSPALTITTPDLVIEEITLLDEPFISGKPMRFKWVLKNKGNGVLHASQWTESAAIKVSVTSDTTKAWSSAFFTVTTSRALNPGDTISAIRTIQLPKGIQGTCYLVAKTNTSRSVYETTAGHLNNILSKSLSVTLAPWTDLTINKLSSSTDSAETGSTWPLRIMVKNIGATVLQDSLWVDKIYLSPQPTLDKDTLLLTGARTSFSLPKDSAYTYDMEVPIPHDLEPGKYYFHVFTDANNEIYEHTGENNNRKVYGPVAIRYGKGPDLVLSEIKAPDSVLSGTIQKLSWKVSNQGMARSFNIWDDAIYLSKDTVWQPKTDLLLSSKLAKNDLDTSMNYVNSEKLTVPENIEGQYYWIVVADYDVKGKPFIESGDRNRANNVVITPVYITRNTAPDLALSNIQAPEEGLAGQSINVQYTVTNQGTGSTRPRKWTDRIYLSTDLHIDTKDQVLATIERRDSLSVGAQYIHTEELPLPFTGSGNYILLIKTDQENVQFEEGLESNNTDFVAIHIEMPLPADLTVTNIKTHKETYLVGDTLKLHWTLQNLGINPVIGSEIDQFYLSKDAIWDINDIVLGSTKSNLNLPPSGKMTLNDNFILSSASVGSYYVIARTDVKNQIPETNEINNTLISTYTIDIDVKELVLNVTEEAFLAHKGRLCYKIVIPDSLLNETLLVELLSSNEFNHNELYIRHGEVPTRNLYDVAFNKPFSGNQEVIIPELKPGIYYVLAYGENEQSQSQEVKLRASILHFNIRSVKTDVGGDTGPVTTCIEGAKFKPNSLFFLSHNNETIQASKVYYISPTKVFATFDLRGVPRGYYDVMAKDTTTGETAINLSGFKVEKGTDPLLEVDLEHPATTRATMIIPIQVHFANGGNIDIPTPRRAVVFTGIKQPIALEVADLKYFTTSLSIDFAEPEGPQDILRPGAFSDKTVYVYTLGHIKLKIIKR